MDKYQPTTKKFIYCTDKEISVLDKLNAYFSNKPREKIGFIETCQQHMSRWGRISQSQYDTLRSIWNNLDVENVDENRESC